MPSGSSASVRAAVAQALSPEKRRLIVTAAAREAAQRAEAAYRAETGLPPGHDTVVDGRAHASLDRLNPDRGEVVFRFARVTEALAWIYDQIVTHSPRLTGRFAASHILLADGQRVDPKNPPAAARYVFMSLAPYAKKIEEGQSSSAPTGVYQAVAVLGERRFGNSVSVGFGYESPLVDYIAGAHGRGARALLRQQPVRVAGMKLERSTRVPIITVTLR
ncbi:hypothetical protein [Methylobacterium sp. ARG-1]|uniref:hypothetical protein n=1 Tax=Methylobacterium sp. ARG-1 TaxID=1692501 RepID=UPI000682FF0B|nr:hypothetical protein [Methylobacterium sp. ARG-1]KNY21653.1 hypothetical protein AKJ13_15510 [Methylobacterium sp. ARG-1]